MPVVLQNQTARKVSERLVKDEIALDVVSLQQQLFILMLFDFQKDAANNNNNNYFNIVFFCGQCRVNGVEPSIRSDFSFFFLNHFLFEARVTLQRSGRGTGTTALGADPVHNSGFKGTVKLIFLIFL